MVVKRPEHVEKAGTANPVGAGSGKPALLEHLVKKSLDINPALRGGQDTGEVLEHLRQQAVAQTRPGAPVAQPASTATTTARRKNTISFFLEQKDEEYNELNAALKAREKQIQDERLQLQARIIDEVSDFLGMMAGGTGSEAREVLHEQRAFLSQLGINEADIIKRITTASSNRR